MPSKELCSRSKRAARIAAARSVPKKSKKIGGRSKNPRAAESSGDEMSNILTLNDDCLLEVFSHMDLKGLCAAKDCCQRFRYLVESIVEKKFRKKEFDDHLSLSSKPTRKVLVEKALMVSKFGKFFTRVEIVGRSKGAWRFGTLWNNCVALKSFKMRKVPIDEVPIAKLEQMLRNIETLELISCWIRPSYLATMLRTTKQLKHLIFYGNTSMTSNLYSSLTELTQIQSIRWRNSDIYDFTPAGLVYFVEKLQPLKQLKQLEILFVRRHNIIAPAMEYLAQIDSLEELTFSWFVPRAPFFKALNEFPNLKLCKLFTYNEIPNDAMVPLTKFTVTKKNTHERDRPSSDYGPMPDRTTILVRKN